MKIYALTAIPAGYAELIAYAPPNCFTADDLSVFLSVAIEKAQALISAWLKAGIVKELE